MSRITHDDLIESARKWLFKAHSIVITEMMGGSEIPDAIGWGGGQSTTLIECKTSHQDFLSDKKKISRQWIGMGDFRYYLVPQGVISLNELPEKWGLLEYKDKRSHSKLIKNAEYQHEKSWRSEMGLLCSALRRIGGLRKEGVSVRVYQYETKNKATLGIARRNR